MGCKSYVKKKSCLYIIVILNVLNGRNDSRVYVRVYTEREREEKNRCAYTRVDVLQLCLLSARRRVQDLTIYKIEADVLCRYSSQPPLHHQHPITRYRSYECPDTVDRGVCVRARVIHHDVFDKLLLTRQVTWECE